MSDEARAEGVETQAGTTVAEGTATGDEANLAGTATVAPSEAQEAEGAEKKPEKLHQTVEMRDIGPCKKHIKVTVDRTDIDRLLNVKFSELRVEANVSGFRTGKAPRKIIERRFYKEVAEEVKAQLLLQSLEQLGEDHDVAPLTTPDISPQKIDIPKQGPLVYEFDVEVRPEFNLPNYKGLKLKRVQRTFTDEDVAAEQRRILGPYGQLIPKEEGDAQLGDYLIADMTTRLGERVLGEIKEITLRVDPVLMLKDGIASDFGEKVTGARAGDVREVDITLSDAAADASLRGQTVRTTLAIKDLKSMRLPELSEQFLEEFGVRSEEELRDRLRQLLERRHEYLQRQSARDQVVEQLTGGLNIEIPQDLLERQARRAFGRRVMEMRSAGISEEEIQARRRLLQQDVLTSTSRSLKEHFVLQKIAEVEKMDVNETDIGDEIEHIALQNDESPRRVRARLEKEDMMEALVAEIVERKALNLILTNGEYEEVGRTETATEEAPMSTVEAQAVPGELHDPTEPPKAVEASAAATGASEEK